MSVFYYLSAAMSVLLMIYLFVALLYPERFSS